MALTPIGDPGDIYAIRTDGAAAAWIRFGSALRGQPNLSNHIAMVHHVDKAGVKWCIEGRPGGVGWADARQYASSGYLLTNKAQPKTAAQRLTLCKITESMLGTAYDWPAIAQDALLDLHLPDLWAEKWNGTTPGHVVCSSLAKWAYMQAGLASPATSDPAHTEPSDWAEFIIENHWMAA